MPCSDSSYTTAASRWTALVTRDTAADGYFVYGVRTTKIYCRPACAARLARRANVSFFTTAREAEDAGYRACRRCQPQQAGAYETRGSRRVREVWEEVKGGERAGDEQQGGSDGDDGHDGREKASPLVSSSSANAPTVTVKAMAASAGLSIAHFHRIFRRLTHLTPRASIDNLIISRRCAQSMGDEALAARASPDPAAGRASHNPGPTPGPCSCLHPHRYPHLHSQWYRHQPPSTAVKASLGPSPSSNISEPYSLSSSRLCSGSCCPAYSVASTAAVIAAHTSADPDPSPSPSPSSSSPPTSSSSSSSSPTTIITSATHLSPFSSILFPSSPPDHPPSHISPLSSSSSPALSPSSRPLSSSPPSVPSTSTSTSTLFHPRIPQRSSSNALARSALTAAQLSSTTLVPTSACDSIFPIPNLVMMAVERAPGGNAQPPPPQQQNPSLALSSQQQHGLSHPHPHPHRQQVLEYTVQPWMDGHVLIGASNGRLYALDMAHVETLVIRAFQAHFQHWNIVASDWAPNNSSSSSSSSATAQNPNHAVFGDIYQALVHPSGKIIHIPFDTWRGPPSDDTGGQLDAFLA